MNLTRQVHLTFIRLRIMDALTKIKAHGFAFAHRDSDPDVFERGGARFFLPGADEPAIVRSSVGTAYSDKPGFRAITSNDNTRLMLTLPARLLHQ